MAAEAGFRVGRAGAPDLEDFLRLRIALFSEAGQARPSFDWSELEPRTRAVYLRGLEDDSLLVWMARAETGEAVGVIALYPLARLPTPLCPSGTEGYVVNVFTLPAWRKRGVGTALMRALIDEARARKLGRLRLHTTAAGRTLYARCGFVEHADNLQLVL